MNQQNIVKFQDIMGLCKVIVALFKIQVIAIITHSIFYFFFIILDTFSTIDLHKSSAPITKVFKFIVAIPTDISAFTLAVTSLLLVVLIPIWFYYAYNNLTPLKASKRKTYSSFGAAICWFIPIIWLFRPIQISKELWIESDPDFIPSLDYLPKADNAPPFATNWWLFFVVAITLLCVLPISIPLLCLAAKDAIKLIKTTTERQNKRLSNLLA